MLSIDTSMEFWQLVKNLMLAGKWVILATILLAGKMLPAGVNNLVGW